MDISFYQIICFGLVAVAFGIFLVLDGCDIGTGMLLPLFRKPGDHDQLMAALAPFWDGNEVWIIIAGGSLYAMFPSVFAAALSAFYLPVFLLAIGLMARAASFEFRHQFSNHKKIWDMVFHAASVVIGAILAVALGNIAGGLQLDNAGNFHGSFFDLFGFLPIVTLLTGIALLSVQGVSMIASRTTGEVRGHALRIGAMAGGLYLLALAIFFVALLGVVHEPMNHLWTIVPVILAIGAATRWVSDVRKKKPKHLLLLSSISVAGAWTATAGLLFPVFIAVPNGIDLTAFSSSSELKTLQIAAPIAAIGFCLIAVMTAVVYRIFKGTVKPGDTY